MKKDMPAKKFEQLVNALALTTGIEALVVSRDICELDDKSGEKMLRWVARTLLKGAMEEQ